jgi:hypothetical protein
MIRSVAREFKWPPNVIGGLFVDDADYLGLEYWYNDVLEMVNETKKQSK